MELTKLGTSPPETYSASAYAALFEDLMIVAFNKSSTVYCFPATSFIPYGITDAVSEIVTLSFIEMAPLLTFSSVSMDVITFVTEASGLTAFTFSFLKIFPFESPTRSA